MNGQRLEQGPPHGWFAAALLDPSLPLPAGLRTWNGSDPARRLAVYRNNVVGSLVDALADTFAVTQQLVGETFFRAMAGVFVRRSPPRSPVLAYFGGGFPDFIAGFAPAATLPYLPDLARLEFARLQACHAAEAAPIAGPALSQALQDPHRLGAWRLHWHPSMRLVESPYAVVSLWVAHQTEGEVAPLAVDHAEAALVLRDGLDVLVLPADAGTACFLRRTLAGATFGAAAAEALAADPAFDLGAALALLVRQGALVALAAPAAVSGGSP